MFLQSKEEGKQDEIIEVTYKFRWPFKSANMFQFFN
jgi:hypothetical protein